MRASILPPPEVILTSDLSANTFNTWRAVVEVNEPPQLFHQHDEVLWIVLEKGRAYIKALNPTVLQRFCTDRIVFLRRAERKPSKDSPEESGYCLAVPPVRLFQNMLAGLHEPVPELDDIITSPVSAPDGTLQLQRGYSPQ